MDSAEGMLPCRAAVAGGPGSPLELELAVRIHSSWDYTDTNAYPLRILLGLGLVVEQSLEPRQGAQLWLVSLHPTHFRSMGQLWTINPLLSGSLQFRQVLNL